MPLTQGKVALIDDEDYDLVARYKWHAHKWGKRSILWYAITNIQLVNSKKTTIRMHTLIMGKLPNLLIDHIDRNGLNNQRSNLRFVTPAQNTYNSIGPENRFSPYKGVHWDKSRSKWMARIEVKGKQINLGRFDDVVEAARVYDEAASFYRGEYALLNFKGDTK